MPSLAKVRSFGATDVGVVREHNEDSHYVDPDGGFFVLADGMGGHAAGEVASSMAVNEVRLALDAAREKVARFAEHADDDGRKQLVELLEEAVRRAHSAVYERGLRETDKKGMGTTLDVVLVAGAEAFVAHVGDSRTYLFRRGRVARLTTDHTVAEVLVLEGKLSAEEARVSPLRTVLVNALGVSADVGVELAHLRLRAGDRLLLCSDGLHDYFPVDGELGRIVDKMGEPTQLVQLVEIAKDRGGHDNITGVVVEVQEIIGDAPEAPVPANEVDSGPTELFGESESTQPISIDGVANLPPIAPADETLAPNIRAPATVGQLVNIDADAMADGPTQPGDLPKDAPAKPDAPDAAKADPPKASNS